MHTFEQTHTTSPKESIRRFPRLFTGSEAAALAKMLCGRATFIVCPAGIRETEAPCKTIRTIVFSYAIDVPDDLPIELRQLFEVLFFGANWQRSLSAAKEKFEDDKKEKRMLERVHNFHRRLVREALRGYLDPCRSLAPEYDAKRAKHLDQFDQTTRLAAGPKPDPSMALTAAIKFRQSVAALDQLLVEVNKLPVKGEGRIKATIERMRLSVEDIKEALEYTFPDVSLTQLLSSSSEQLAHSMVSCELEKRGCDLDQISERTYVRAGTKMLEILENPAAR